MCIQPAHILLFACVFDLCHQVGIAVEFTAHLVHAYAEARQESRQARVQAALTSMGVPILNGGLSTLIGIVMLAFSPVSCT